MSEKPNNENSIFDKLNDQYMEYQNRFTSYIFDIEKAKTIIRKILQTHRNVVISEKR